MSRFARLKVMARERAELEARDLPAARRLRFSLAADALERHARGRPLTVLDAGCGEALLAESLARRHRDWTIVAGDLSEDRLEIARRRLRAGGVSNVEVSRVDLTADLGSEAYDAVLAVECLEEIPRDDDALAAMARALRPGGLLVAHVPERDWSPVLRGSEAAWRHEVRHGYEIGELTEKLRRAGLQVTAVRPTSHAVVRVVQEARDRARNRSILVHVLILPFALLAVALERRGLRVGRGRALVVTAVRR
jgi:SAM-dependent methyltransferase